MKKTSVSIVCLIMAIVLLCMSFAGCSNSESKETESDSASAGANGEQQSEKFVFPEAKLSEDGKEITLEDQAGRTVVIPSKINSIVTTYPVAGNILIALGASDRVVGVDNSAATSKVYQALAPQLCQLPGVGNRGAINIEETMNLNPDLVIVPANWAGDVAALEKSGLNYVVINPEGIELLFNTIAILGNATGTTDKAKELIAYYEEQCEKMRELVKKVDEPTRVYLASHRDKLMGAGGGMLQTHLIELAGGKNVAAEVSTKGWSQFSIEQIMEWDPEVIFTVQYSTYDDEEFFNDSQWSNISAVANKKVYRIPSYLDEWDTPVPASILGIMWMTSKLYPEIYTQEQMTADVLAYYEKFYGKTLTSGDLGL